ncbi:DUF4097 domain-containing protein [Filibacter tadaridae]|uniref:DUF4097 domain-containing protein n=1 Tax=Filibacter tadaridae TaxID=2483811 RepID=A0A3P5XDA1_9BACL|nr:DUF4097 family beta strand repeat-containing protein [Filibacter tadaridae]VDC25504.1 hypothetical protein FILTAD_01210 [Filibacter tadaridae]
MTENQFILELESALKKLPAEELADIRQDIREYFTDGREDGKSESDIADSLGSPDKIAQELLATYSFVETKTKEPISSLNDIVTLQDNSYTKVDINVRHGALVVAPSDTSTTTVELVGSNDKLKLTAEVVGDTLSIQLKSTRHWLFNFNMKAVILNVFIPTKLYQSYAMKTDNGRIEAEKLLGKKIIAKTDNGKIRLTEIAATVLHAETDNGRIEIKKVQADQLKTKTDNGRIEMHTVEADSITAESDNGRIVFEQVNGNLTAATDNGRITLQTLSLDQNVDFKTDNGSIAIRSENAPTNVSIHAKTSHGKIDIFGERNSRTVFGAGEHTIRLKSDNGRITVS